MMTHWYGRILVLTGLLCVAVAGGRLWISTSQGAQPVRQSYFVCPEGGPVHAPGCRYVDWERKDLIELPGQHAIEARTLARCEECFSGRESGTSRTSQASRLPSPTGTARPPSRESGR